MLGVLFGMVEWAVWLTVLVAAWDRPRVMLILGLAPTIIAFTCMTVVPQLEQSNFSFLFYNSTLILFSVIPIILSIQMFRHNRFMSGKSDSW